MIGSGCGTSGRVGREMREEPRGSLAWIPARVSVGRDFMIAKDPHPRSTETLRQEQSLRDLDGAAGIICVLYPEYPDFIPRHPASAAGSSRVEAGQNPGSSSSVAIAVDWGRPAAAGPRALALGVDS